MVSKRQREAKKRLMETNPDLFPKPNENSKKKEEKKKKKLKPNSIKKMKKNKTGGSKHPLRVPGMRPGECCFICKSTEHIAKNCPQKSHWEKNKICLLCRERGHSLKNCPQKEEEEEDKKKKMCYNCGQVGHSLSKCPQPLQDGGTKFASCFVCNERGHLSKNCPKNTHGIYPKGGCCKICGGVTHLAKDCPNRANRDSVSSMGQSAGNFYGSGQGKRTVLSSGDDLEDDFMVEEGIKNAVPSSNSGPATVGAVVQKDVKSKKKQGPKIVNFFG